MSDACLSHRKLSATLKLRLWKSSSAVSRARLFIAADSSLQEAYILNTAQQSRTYGKELPELIELYAALASDPPRYAVLMLTTRHGRARIFSWAMREVRRASRRGRSPLSVVEDSTAFADAVSHRPLTILRLLPAELRSELFLDMLDETRIPLLRSLNTDFKRKILADLADYQDAMWAQSSQKLSAVGKPAAATFFGTHAVATGQPRTPEAFKRCAQCMILYTVGQGIYRSPCGIRTRHQDCMDSC